MSVNVYGSIADLPASHQELLDEAGKGDFFQSREWFENLIETTSHPGVSPRLYTLESDNGIPEALLITRRRTSRSGFFANRSLCGCSNLYSVNFAPLCRTGLRDAPKLAEPLVQAMARHTKWHTLRFDCWNRDSPLFSAFVTALRRQRFLVQPYFHFGNWFETVAGQSFETYLAKRPSILVNTLRRKRRNLEAREGVRFEIISSAQRLNDGVDAYSQVYDASWKPPEPYPAFTEGLMRAAVETGALRLGVLWLKDQPVAAQIWIVAGGRATIFKLAHREDLKELSPGSLLTHFMMQEVMETEDLREVDFGRGDESFKQLWLSQRRERWGLIAFNPKTVSGLRQAVVQILGRTVKRGFSRS